MHDQRNKPNAGTDSMLDIPKPAIDAPRHILTARERDCLMLSGRGHSEKEIAKLLDISPNTVRVHVENSKRKLGAENKTHAVVLSLIYGELKLSDYAENRRQHALTAAADRTS